MSTPTYSGQRHVAPSHRKALLSLVKRDLCLLWARFPVPSHSEVCGVFVGVCPFMCCSQLLDNALVAAGLLDDPRTMLPRLNKLLELLSSPRVVRVCSDCLLVASGRCPR